LNTTSPFIRRFQYLLSLLSLWVDTPQNESEAEGLAGVPWIADGVDDSVLDPVQVATFVEN